MARPRKIDRPKQIEIRLPESVHGLLMDQLYSEVEGRVPLGALSTLFEDLTVNWLKSRGVAL